MEVRKMTVPPPKEGERRECRLDEEQDSSNAPVFSGPMDQGDNGWSRLEIVGGCTRDSTTPRNSRWRHTAKLFHMARPSAAAR